MFQRVYQQPERVRSGGLRYHDYYWSGSNNNAADFRYVFETMSLTDTAGNSDTVYLEDEYTARICYTSTAYVKQDRCASGISPREAERSATVWLSTATSKPQWQRPGR